jgi:hypothetical protein
MIRQFTAPVIYFLEEGRNNLTECLRSAFRAAQNHDIEKIIIFTAQGAGVAQALDEFCTQPAFAKVKLVAVTFPVGQPFKDGDGKPVACEIPPDLRERFREKSVPVIRAHMPFDPISAQHRDRGVLGHDLSLVESSLNAFGGSMSLCVQAVMIACDAGEVDWGEHVIAMTSDTAILAQAAPTRQMLRDLAIREILCKPVIYSVGRGEKADQLLSETDEAVELQEKKEPKALEGELVPPKKNRSRSKQ